MAFTTPQWDLALFWQVNHTMRSSLLDFMMPLISNSLFMWGLVALILGFVAQKTGEWKRLLAGLLLVAAFAGASDFTAGIVKKQFKRVRPYNTLASTYFVEDGRWQQRPENFVQKKQKGKSYVSAHAANSMAAALAALLIWPALSRFVLLVPFLIGFSRLYLGKHYPSDVLGGWGLGICVFIVLWLLIPETFIQRFRLRKQHPQES